MDALTESRPALITISVVSHGQMNLVSHLLDDLAMHCSAVNFEVILTSNIPEEISLKEYKFPLHILRNEKPKGFGGNHNQAFREAKGQFFCIVNPDIRLPMDPFGGLITSLQDDAVGVVAPSVLNGDGGVEDSAREFPSPLVILMKMVGVKHHLNYRFDEAQIYPDWVAGMFMLFRSATFKDLNGFDERYFLYYEDVDICARLANEGKRVVLCPSSRVIHLAQRTSHRNFRYLRWHMSSMLRFFLSKAYLRFLWR